MQKRVCEDVYVVLFCINCDRHVPLGAVATSIVPVGSLSWLGKPERQEATSGPAQFCDIMHLSHASIAFGNTIAAVIRHEAAAAAAPRAMHQPVINRLCRDVAAAKCELLWIAPCSRRIVHAQSPLVDHSRLVVLLHTLHWMSIILSNTSHSTCLDCTVKSTPSQVGLTTSHGLLDPSYARPCDQDFFPKAKYAAAAMMSSGSSALNMVANMLSCRTQRSIVSFLTIVSFLSAGNVGLHTILQSAWCLDTLCPTVSF